MLKDKRLHVLKRVETASDKQGQAKNVTMGTLLLSMTDALLLVLKKTLIFVLTTEQGFLPAFQLVETDYTIQQKMKIATTMTWTMAMDATTRVNLKISSLAQKQKMKNLAAQMSVGTEIGMKEQTRNAMTIIPSRGMDALLPAWQKMDMIAETL